MTPPALPSPEDFMSLDDLGLEQIEPGIVEDNHHNRVALREAGLRWTQVDDREETPGPGSVPTIRVISSLEARKAAEDQRLRKHDVLVDPEDGYSDYISPLDLGADAPVPFWVKSSARKWREAEKAGKDPENNPAHWMPVRCHAIKSDGTRCWLWAGTSTQQRDTGLCRTHLGTTGVHRDQYIESARLKLAQAAPAAADTVEALLNADQEAVRLKAAAEILDRTGVKTAIEVNTETLVTHVNASEAVRERLDKLREARIARLRGEATAAVEARSDIVDAEIVE